LKRIRKRIGIFEQGSGRRRWVRPIFLIGRGDVDDIFVRELGIPSSDRRMDVRIAGKWWGSSVRGQARVEVHCAGMSRVFAIADTGCYLQVSIHHDREVALGCCDDTSQLSVFTRSRGRWNVVEARVQMKFWVDGRWGRNVRRVGAGLGIVVGSW
jgi:hypothetical protein